MNWTKHTSSSQLIPWGRVTYLCVSKLTIIGWDNGLSPGRRQAIISTSAGILFIGPLGTNFRVILIGIETFAFDQIYLSVSFAKWRPFCIGLNVLSDWSPLFAYCLFVTHLGCRHLSHCLMCESIVASSVPSQNLNYRKSCSMSIKSSSMSPKTSIFLVSSCICLCPIHWSHVKSKMKI